MAAELDFWPSIRGNREIDGGVVYFLIPLCLVAINSLGIGASTSKCSSGSCITPVSLLTRAKKYGPTEVVFGILKITMYLVIVVSLIAILILNRSELRSTVPYAPLASNHLSIH